MNKVLVVEDSPVILKILKKLISGIGRFEPHYASSLEEASQLIKNPDNNYFAAIADLNLPDAPSGEVIEHILAKDIPTIVLTGSFDDKKRESLFAQGVVDYVVKESRFSYEYAINLITRLEKNIGISVLVVEDSKPSRTFIRKILQKHLFQVYEAENGIEAIEMLNKHPEIHMMITDYNMPEMDGFQLTTYVRRTLDKSNLVIIGLSADGQSSLSAKFIKNGANDFLKKPFLHEEFYCRVNHNIEEMELINQIKDAANRDYITGLYNRRYFFNQSEEIIQRLNDSNVAISYCVLSIDHFREFNEKHGRDIGDSALVHLANLLDSHLSKFLCTRLEGESFGILFPKLDQEKATLLIDQVRQIVEKSSFETEDESFSISFSAGVAQLKTNMDDMVKDAEECLYRAEDAGRNIVICND